MQTKQSNIETRVFKTQELRAEMQARVLKGYAAVYDSPSEDLGGFTERIAPGAFNGVLGDDVRALFNHEDSMILGRTTAGTMRLYADENGLRYEIDIPDTTYGNDLLESVRRGDITQSSFGFWPADEEWDRSAKPPVRTITKVARLYDVSPVTYPAYPDTSVALRKLKQIEQTDEDLQRSEAIQTEQAQLSRALILKQKLIKR